MCNDVSKCIFTKLPSKTTILNRVTEAMTTAANACIPVTRSRGIWRPGWNDTLR